MTMNSRKMSCTKLSEPAIPCWASARKHKKTDTGQVSAQPDEKQNKSAGYFIGIDQKGSWTIVVLIKALLNPLHSFINVETNPLLLDTVNDANIIFISLSQFAAIEHTCNISRFN